MTQSSLSSRGDTTSPMEPEGCWTKQLKKLPVGERGRSTPLGVLGALLRGPTSGGVLPLLAAFRGLGFSNAAGSCWDERVKLSGREETERVLVILNLSSTLPNTQPAAWVERAIVCHV